MFRPCIDLHDGKVKQIVGGTLGSQGLKTNFVSEKSSAWFARLFREDNLKGGHVIMLGAGNRNACFEALQEFPGGLQAGGGITPQNAEEFLNAGASHVIVTSYLFPEGRFSLDRLREISGLVGKERLVVDLSCLRHKGSYYAAINRWQTITDIEISADLLQETAAYCDEFLIHSVGVEGLQQGMDLDLISLLAANSPIEVTYAGGAKSLEDLVIVQEKGGGKVHLTIGSALDIFGGNGVKYEELTAYNKGLLNE